MPLSSGGNVSTGGGGGLPPAGSVTNTMFAAATPYSVIGNPLAGTVSPTNIVLNDNALLGKEPSNDVQSLNLYYKLLTHNHNLFAMNGTPFQFSTGVLDNDPGVGKFKFNSATLGSITKLWIDDVDFKSNSFVTMVNSVITSDILLYRSTANPYTIFGVLAVTSSVIVNKTGYREVSVQHKAGVLPSDLDLCEIVHLPTGHIMAGFSGTQGDKAGVRAVFNSEIVDTNVTTGKVGFNSATLGTVGQIFINKTGAGSIDLTAWLDTFVTNGYIYLNSNSNADTSQAIFKISGNQIDNAGKRIIPVSYVAGSTNFTNLEEMVVNYTPGDPGTATFAQSSDLPTPGGNPDLIAAVKNPGNNLAAYNPVPWTVMSDSTKWRSVNGYAMLAHWQESLKLIQTATQVTAIASANGGNSVTLTATAHGLTIGAGWAGYNLPFDGTGGWTNKFYPIENVVDANTIQVAAAFAGKTNPTLILANTNVVIHSPVIPWMNPQSRLRITAAMTTPAGNTNVRRLKVRYGGVEIYNYNIGLVGTTLGLNAVIGLNNNTSSSETQMWSPGSASGSGTITSSPPGAIAVDNSIYQPLDFIMMGAVNEPMKLEHWEIQVCL